MADLLRVEALDDGLEGADPGDREVAVLQQDPAPRLAGLRDQRLRDRALNRPPL